MIKNNQRLNTLVSFIKPNSIIADIGTDHAYLPIQAVKELKASFAFAADINIKPLEQAEKNIIRFNLEEKIDVILSDGLDYFQKNNIHLDYVTISGLGSSTIVEIMKNDYDRIKNYIVCSNTEPSLIRKFIKDRKMFLQKEMFFLDNNKKYWLLVISKKTGNKIKTKKDIFLSNDKELFFDKEYLKYLKTEKLKNLEIITKLNNKKKKKKLINNNKMISKVI